MKSCELVFHCHFGLHARPAAIITKIASIFENCTTQIVHKNARISLRNIIGLMQEGIQDKTKLILEVDGVLEDIALVVMKGVLENLDLMRYGELGTSEGRGHAEDLFQELSALLAAEDSIYNDWIKRKISVALHLSEEEKVFKVKAVLNSKKGIHMLPSTLFPYLREDFSSEIFLLYNQEEGDPDVINIYDTMELMVAKIAHGAALIVKATGPDCKRAANSVKNILEHMEEITMELVEHQYDRADLLRKYYVD